MDGERSSVSRREFVQGGALGFVAQATPGPRPTGKVVRMGVVGGEFGLQFQWHLDPNCQVTAVCDLREDRQKALCKTYRCSAAYRDYRQFLKHPELDAVAIFTPVPLHAWMATEAMKVGKHVVSAVPVGMSLEQLESVMAAVKRSGLRYMMAETSYYMPQTITCREWARQGKFGEIFYTEAEYFHPGIIMLARDERGMPTWRFGYPPLLYPTHCTGLVIPVTGERLVEVTAMGWGDDNEVLKTNQYRNPFWNEVGLFKTSQGHASRIAVFKHLTAKGGVRATFFGDKLTYTYRRPEGIPDTISRIQASRVDRDDAGYSAADIKVEPYPEPDHFELLPKSMRVQTGHLNSHTFLSHEFVRSIVEDRHPTVNIWEAVAYTAPGIVGHQSALQGGVTMKIPDYGVAPA